MHELHSCVTDWGETSNIAYFNGFWVGEIFSLSPFLLFPYCERNIDSLFCNSTHLSPTSSCDGTMLEADALPLYYEHSCRHILMTLMTPNDTGAYSPHLSWWFGDCIPLNASTWISTDAGADESSVIPADRFFYTKVPRLCWEIDIPVRIIRNRDMKVYLACWLLPVDWFKFCHAL